MSGKRNMKTGTSRMHCCALICGQKSLVIRNNSENAFQIANFPSPNSQFCWRECQWRRCKINIPFQISKGQENNMCLGKRRISWALHEHRHTHTHTFSGVNGMWCAFIFSYIRTYITIDGTCWNGKWIGMNEPNCEKMWKYLQENRKSYHELWALSSLSPKISMGEKKIMYKETDGEMFSV